MRQLLMVALAVGMVGSAAEAAILSMRFAPGANTISDTESNLGPCDTVTVDIIWTMEVSD